jgi:hypothetical protein
MSYVDFSSWPRDQEQTFVVFEQRSNESQRKAWIGGAVAAIVVFVTVVGIYASVTPDIKDVSKDMNMSNLTKKKSAAAPAPAPDKAPAAAPEKAPEAAPAPESK